MRFSSDSRLRSRAIALIQSAISQGKRFVTGLTRKAGKSGRTVIECKEIVYRGGIVRFKIPRHWIEEYEPAGGAMFYADHSDAGILRLNVITFETEEPVTDNSAVDSIAALAELGFSDAVISPEGSAIATAFKRMIDDGEAISMHSWCVACPIPPRMLRLAQFTFTVLTSLEDAQETRRDLALLNDSIEHAEFGPSPGIVGDYYHDSQ